MNTCTDNRIGFFFNNPDLTGDRYIPGWGRLVTPDEIRYVTLAGNPLIAENGDEYDDNMLQEYIDQALAIVERDLNIHIVKRVQWYQDMPDNQGSLEVRTVPDELKAMGRYFRRVEGYPWRQEYSNKYLYTKLRERPLISVDNAKIVTPYNSLYIDISTWKRVVPGYEASVSFYPTNLMSVSDTSFLQYGMTYPFRDFPQAIFIDYTTGFNNANDVDVELREIVRLTAGYQVLMDYGDAKIAGISNASINLNSISESFGTTQSATSGYFGSRMLSIEKRIKEWMKRNASKYARNTFGVI